MLGWRCQCPSAALALLSVLQVQAESRSGLAELPGLQARVSSLQQQLEQAHEEEAAAQQAAVAAEQQLQGAKLQLEQANKVKKGHRELHKQLRCKRNPAEWQKGLEDP